MPNPKAQIRSNQRVGLFGKTGSGKTTMALYLLAPIRRLIVLDPKGTLTDDIWRLEEGSKVERRLRNGEDGRLRVPSPLDQDWLPWLQMAWEIGRCTVYIDEMYGVVDPGTRAPRELTALYTRGRERGIGVWAASQRPAWVPLMCISEAEWLFVFRLQLEADRRRLSEVGGPEITIPVRHPFGYWLYNTGWDSPIYSSGLRLNPTQIRRREVADNESRSSGREARAV